MTGFRGRLCARGTFALDDVIAPEEHAGCRVAVSGYVAGRTALMARLGVDPADRPSDCALLAHAFRAWGRDLQRHVLGEYSAVVWDAQARTALLTHDALGLGPLFYTACDGGVTAYDGVRFATDLADLVDAAAADDLDEEYLADFVACGFAAGERTPYRSIRRLTSGGSLWWSGARLQALRTWDPADVPDVACRSDAEYEERFRALLEQAVREALAPGGTAWISLSGGLDSSSIACVAGDAGARDVAAYSVLLPDWSGANERPWMQAVVDRCGLPWHTQDIEDALPFASLPRTFFAEPAAGIVNEAQARRSDALLAANGVRVLLTGHGGDGVLGASPGSVPHHLADPAFVGDPLAALRAVAAWKRRSREPRSTTYWVRRALLEPAAEHLRGERIRGAGAVPLPAWLDRGYTASRQLARRARRRVAPACREPGRQAFWDELWIASLAASSVPRRAAPYELRTPLLYRPLVEFMAGIPWEQKLRPRCDRYLQRRALAGVLPETVRRRGGKAVGTAVYLEGLRRSRDWASYLGDDSLMAARGMVDADAWRGAIRRASLGQTHGDALFLAGVAVEAWLQELSRHRGPAAASLRP